MGSAGGRRAFTITELLVVLAIISILSVTAIGGYTRFREGRALRTAAENLAAAMTAARSFAISTNAPHRLVIQMRDPVDGSPKTSYWVDEIFPNSNEEPFPTVPEGARTPKVTTPEFLPEGVRLLEMGTANTTQTLATVPFAIIRFFRDGSSDQVRLVFLDENATDATTARQVVTLSLNPATGQRQLRTINR